MADNITILDSAAASQTMATKQISSVHFPYNTQLGAQVQTSFTRPANATAYSVGDIVNNSTSAPVVETFSGCARFNGGTLKLSSAILESTNAPPGTPPNFDLLLFDTSVTPQNDNAALALSDADMAHCVAVLPFIGAFPFFTSSTGNMVWHWEANGGGKLIKSAAADTALYGIIRINNTYTPLTGEVFTITLNLIPE